jgi:ADP-ribose pyrophosphatase YjhB (NUDIX family)
METTKHYTVTTIIVHQQKVLLHWHEKLQLWLPVGGHIERDELPTTAALREVMEESGLEVEIYDPDINMDLTDAKQLTRPAHILLEDIQPGHQHIDFVFYARSETNILNIPSDKKTNYRWLSADELSQIPLKHNVRILCLDALNCIYN